MSIQLYLDYKDSDCSMYKDGILKTTQMVLRMGNMYDSRLVSMNEYFNILTQYQLNGETSTMCRGINIAGAQECHSRIRPTGIDKYGSVLNGRSLCTESVGPNSLLSSTSAATTRH